MYKNISYEKSNVIFLSCYKFIINTYTLLIYIVTFNILFKFINVIFFYNCILNFNKSNITKKAQVKNYNSLMSCCNFIFSNRYWLVNNRLKLLIKYEPKWKCVV